MDNYIYYKILKCLRTQGKTLRSDLFFLVGMPHKKGNPIDSLWEKGFIKEIIDDVDTFGNTKHITYYVLTNEGTELYEKMDEFYNFCDQLLRNLHNKMNIGETTREKIIATHKYKN